MKIKKDIFKSSQKGKTLKLSWLTKLKNSEFIASTKIIYELAVEATKDNENLPPQALEMLGGLIHQISNLPPTQRSHELTQVINSVHSHRKKRLTTIRQYIKTIISAPEIFSTQEVSAAKRIGGWLQDIYGTRHYDMGIGKLTAKLDTMFIMLDNDSELMEAFVLCSHPDALNNLSECHEMVVASMLQRDIDMGERDLEPGFVKLRAEIYKHIKAIVRFIEAQLIFNIEVDMMLNANLMLYNYINPKQANYKQQATKRRLARGRCDDGVLLSLREDMLDVDTMRAT